MTLRSNTKNTYCLAVATAEGENLLRCVTAFATLVTPPRAETPLTRSDNDTNRKSSKAILRRTVARNQAKSRRAQISSHRNGYCLQGKDTGASAVTPARSRHGQPRPENWRKPSAARLVSDYRFPVPRPAKRSPERLTRARRNPYRGAPGYGLAFAEASDSPPSGLAPITYHSWRLRLVPDTFDSPDVR
jgi:hypothetical protein